jgi:endonuclease/exonuclease/phosphatase family metal-dependent hydrolase
MMHPMDLLHGQGKMGTENSLGPRPMWAKQSSTEPEPPPMKRFGAGSVAATALLLSVLVLTGCAGPRVRFTPDEAAAYRPFASPREIRILTINVWSGLTYEGTLKVGRYADQPKKRYEALVAGIRELAPDIIAIQEANPLPDYAEHLAADLDYRVIYAVALGGIRLGPVGVPWNLREGNALLVKKPWTVVEVARARLGGWGIATNWLCFHFADITQGLISRVVVNGKPLYVCNAHLHSGPFHGPAFDKALARLATEVPAKALAGARQRAEDDIARRNAELHNLKGFLGETLPPGAPTVLLGGFNTTRESGELEGVLAGGKWLDSFLVANSGADGPTWDPAHNPNIALQAPMPDPYGRLCHYHDSHPSRLDLILLSNVPRERVVQSRVVLTPRSDGFCASDHYGVLTTLMW